MPWNRARDLLAAVGRDRQQRQVEAATAFRAAQADDKNWSAWVARATAVGE